jgi:arsenate reductase
MFSDTFAGIAPASVPGFAVAQFVGAVVAVGVIGILYPALGPTDAADVVMPHDALAGGDRAFPGVRSE